MYGLQAEAHFDGAHFLTDYYGKCENLHGHRWRVVATIEVEELQDEHAPMPDGLAQSPYAKFGRGRIASTHVPGARHGKHAGKGTDAAASCGHAGTMRDMVLDFGVFKRTVAEVADELDHTFLVEEGSLKPATIAALEDEGFTLSVLPFRTTAENLASWFFDRLSERGLPISQVEVDETPNNRAFYAKKGHVGR